MVMVAVEYPLDLHALISADPRSLQIFLQNPEYHLSQVLQNTIVPEALPHALLIQALDKSDILTMDKTLFSAMLSNHFEKPRSNLPKDRQELTQLIRRHTRLHRLWNWFAARSLQRFLRMLQNLWEFYLGGLLAG